MDQEKKTEHHLGERLRQMREKAGMSHAELAAMTRISKRHLEALEEGRLDKMPGLFFIRGFIRTICTELHEDPSELLEILEYLFPEEETIEEPEGTTSGFKRILLPLIAAVVLVLILIGGNMLTRRGEEKKAQEGPTTGAEAMGPTGEVSTPVEPEPDLDEANAAVDLELVIRAVERTWLRIQTDDSDSWETTMRPGDEVRLRAAENINLVIGNAGGVIFDLNGRRFGPPGSHGQVLTNYVLTRDNL
jgi:cytoskeletal protein RodZ